jgi:hypothetical protein
MTDLDTAAYLEELAAALASHGSNLAALRMAELEQKVSPYLAAPGVPSTPGSVAADSALAGLGSAYSTSVAMGAAGLFITDGAITVTNPGSTVIIDGTSNMFKIAASGTQTVNYPNATWSGTYASVTLTALGNGYTTPPANHSNSLFNGDAGTHGDGMFGIGASGMYGHQYTSVAVVSGYLEARLHAYSDSYNWGANGGVASSRYYILKEAGI